MHGKRMEPDGNVIHLSAQDIKERIRRLQEQASNLAPTSERHQEITREIARLRIYAETKRFVS